MFKGDWLLQCQVLTQLLVLKLWPIVGLLLTFYSSLSCLVLVLIPAWHFEAQKFLVVHSSTWVPSLTWSLFLLSFSSKNIVGSGLISFVRGSLWGLVLYICYSMFTTKKESAKTCALYLKWKMVWYMIVLISCRGSIPLSYTLSPAQTDLTLARKFYLPGRGASHGPYPGAFAIFR